MNGEYVTFRGHVRGRWIPPEGTLVELQVFTRGTLADLRAAAGLAGHGRWEFQYRFETIRGNVTFRFRARIRGSRTTRSAPDTRGSLRVTVHGL